MVESSDLTSGVWYVGVLEDQLYGSQQCSYSLTATLQDGDPGLPYGAIISNSVGSNSWVYYQLSVPALQSRTILVVELYPTNTTGSTCDPQQTYLLLQNGQRPTLNASLPGVITDIDTPDQIYSLVYALSASSTSATLVLGIFNGGAATCSFSIMANLNAVQTLGFGQYITSIARADYWQYYSFTIGNVPQNNYFVLHLQTDMACASLPAIFVNRGMGGQMAQPPTRSSYTYGPLSFATSLEVEYESLVLNSSQIAPGNYLVGVWGNPSVLSCPYSILAEITAVTPINLNTQANGYTVFFKYDYFSLTIPPGSTGSLSVQLESECISYLTLLIQQNSPPTLSNYLVQSSNYTASNDNSTGPLVAMVESSDLTSGVWYVGVLEDQLSGSQCSYSLTATLQDDYDPVLPYGSALPNSVGSNSWVYYQLSVPALQSRTILVVELYPNNNPGSTCDPQQTYLLLQNGQRPTLNASLPGVITDIDMSDQIYSLVYALSASPTSATFVLGIFNGGVATCSFSIMADLDAVKALGIGQFKTSIARADDWQYYSFNVGNVPSNNFFVLHLQTEMICSALPLVFVNGGMGRQMAQPPTRSSYTYGPLSFAMSVEQQYESLVLNSSQIAPGNYLVGVWGDPSILSCTYSILVQIPAAPTLNLNTQVSGLLSFFQYDYFSLEITSGSTGVLLVELNSDCAALLYLFIQQNSPPTLSNYLVQSSINATGNSSANYLAAVVGGSDLSPGTWYVGMLDDTSYGSQMCSYNIIARLQADTSLDNTTGVQNVLQPQNYNFYHFVASGSTAELYISSVVGSGLVLYGKVGGYPTPLDYDVHDTQTTANASLYAALQSSHKRHVPAYFALYNGGNQIAMYDASTSQSGGDGGVDGSVDGSPDGGGSSDGSDGGSDGDGDGAGSIAFWVIFGVVMGCFVLTLAATGIWILIKKNPNLGGGFGFRRLQPVQYYPTNSDLAQPLINADDADKEL
jgi:hypothetical protein